MKHKIASSTGIAIATLATLLVTTNAQAQGTRFHDPEEIDRAVASFTGAVTGQDGGARTAVDRSLRLARCDGPLQLEYYGHDKGAVRVSCPTFAGWRIFVPLAQTRMAEAAPVVMRRDAVRVEAAGRGFRVARPGEALENGRPGQAIRVKIDDGTRQGKVVSARVIEAGRLEILQR